MRSTFFARRALPILCIVFFLTPFAMRGARMSLQRMTNNVKDWLPADFPETRDLEWFGRHFMGEQFLIVTWPGCTAEDPRFKKMVELLKGEVAPPAGNATASTDLTTGPIAASPKRKPFEQLTPAERDELDRRRALEVGDTLGLTTAADEFYNWGRKGEKWLRGDNDLWYYVTPDGELYRWTGRNNLMGYLSRTIRRNIFGNRTVEGELVTTLGGPSSAGEANPFYADPHLLTARLFKSITTGPDTLEQLSRPDGPLWPRGLTDEFASQEARQLALERLSGTLIGPDGKQVCILLTLSEPGKRNLRRVIGRPILGRPPGRLLELASQQCGIEIEDLKLGGPPVDNVAIDEEGQITLARLIGYSACIGLFLSLVCFRSVKITIMIFFVGGVGAIASLGIVWWCGGSVDAILMSMPSLVYVLGLSGAVHIINYYRDAVEENGLVGAPEQALAHGWKPCTLAAFTTALGLLSLNTSNIVPIRKFGFYSAIGVMATLVLLYTYLPSALQMWPPGYKQRKKNDDSSSGFDLQKHLIGFWEPIGKWIVNRWTWVAGGCTAVLVIFAFGLPEIKTCVQLIKMFDEDSKVIRDYAWLEEHLGKLVPMELVIRVRPERMQSIRTDDDNVAANASPTIDDRLELDFLERMEIAARVQQVVESEFGDQGQGIVGHGMSVPSFAPELPPPGLSTIRNPLRSVMNRKLVEHRDEYLATDYLRIDREAPNTGSELWRVSLRLGALLDVDYGQFVNELRRVVEPVMSAYSYRDKILRGIDRKREGQGFIKARVAFLGVTDPAELTAAEKADAANEENENAPTTADDRSTTDRKEIDQTRIFARTLRDLMTNAGVYARRGCWHEPDEAGAEPSFYSSDAWAKVLAEKFDCVVLVRDHEAYDIDFIKQHAGLFIDAREHRFDSESPASLTAVARNDPIQAIYTGVVPIVYKAQRTLLVSLIDSIGCAFLMIALVMMVLLRSGPWRLGNLLNFRAGLVSMIPNVFPVVIIFGGMGFLAIDVDIGTMMTASVAMGVAVDDTIHFLTWFRQGIAEGLPRNQAIIDAYKRCAAAMTQTTLIGGLGLAVFAFSTFTPTQCFGLMMLTLLLAALVGDLIFLPALLASPMGRWFCPEVTSDKDQDDDTTSSIPPPKAGVRDDTQEEDSGGFAQPHVPGRGQKSREGLIWRTDPGHNR